jgi:hypothetical protein
MIVLQVSRLTGVIAISEPGRAGRADREPTREIAAVTRSALAFNAQQLLDGVLTSM